MPDEAMKIDARAAGGAGFVGGLAAGVLAMAGLIGSSAEGPPGDVAPGDFVIAPSDSAGISIVTSGPSRLVDSEGRPVIFFTSDAAVEARAQEIHAQRQADYLAEEQARLAELQASEPRPIFRTTDSEPR